MIIGIAGFADSGKGTVSDFFVEEYNYKKIAFADPLKDCISDIFGWSRALLEGDTDESRAFRETPDEWWSKKLGFEITPRWAMRQFGTETVRAIHGDIWTNALERQVGNEKNIVVADVRFPNEIQKVKDLGGFVVRVRRGPEPEWFDSAFEQNVNGNPLMDQFFPDIHYSEWAWIGTPMNYLIDNNGSKQELRGNISHMMKIFTGPLDKKGE